MTSTEDFQLRARCRGRDCQLLLGRRELLTQRVPADCRPYLHPLRTVDGQTVLTEDAPDHHPWQHGVYTGLHAVDGEEFWTEGPDDGRIRGELASVAARADGIAWRVDAQWIGADGDLRLVEHQDWDLQLTATGYHIDLEWTLSAERAIRIGAHAYGGLFCRMPVADPAAVDCLTSEGDRGRDGEGRRARWVALSLPVGPDGRSAGLAICDHPANQAHPQPWRIDAQYGIGPSRSILGDWSIDPAAPARARYRILPFDGAIDGEAIERCWQAFAIDPTEHAS